MRIIILAPATLPTTLPTTTGVDGAEESSDTWPEPEVPVTDAGEGPPPGTPAGPPTADA